jgi:hypothetical protein
MVDPLPFHVYRPLQIADPQFVDLRSLFCTSMHFSSANKARAIGDRPMTDLITAHTSFW